MTDERAHLFLPPSADSGQRLPERTPGLRRTGLGLIIAILAVSAASIFIRLAQADGAPSLVIAALRLTFATLLLSPIVLSRHHAELRNLRREDLLLSTVSGIFLAIHFATWISSLEYTSVASSAVFVSTGPLWVALVSPLFLNERLSRIAVIGLVLALLGGTMIGLIDACSFNGGFACPELGQALHGRSMWGNFLALAGAWAVPGDWKKSAWEYTTPSIHFPGIRHCCDCVNRIHVHSRGDSVRAFFQSISLDPPAYSDPSIDRTFHLQLAAQILLGNNGGSHHAGRAHWRVPPGIGFFE
jgi:uncharacterized membrane protein